jgi:hypothetical protein
MGPCSRMLLKQIDLDLLFLTGCHGIHREYNKEVTPKDNFSNHQMLQISLNANLLSQSGGPCVCTKSDLCVSDPVYNLCVSQVRNDLIVSTAIISSISSLLMGSLANLPVCLAPGLGVNAYVRFERD